jgi:hypothetical protein
MTPNPTALATQRPLPPPHHPNHLHRYHPPITLPSRLLNYSRRQWHHLTVNPHRHQSAIAQHQPHLPQITDPLYQYLLTQLQQTGIATTTIAEITQRSNLLTQAQAHIPSINQQTPKKHQFCHHLDSHHILTTPDLYLWGLQTPILNLIENYLQIPPAYHGLYYRRDINSHHITKSRQWHLDMEDHRILKIIIYLTDVDQHNGPFQYLTDPDTQTIRARLHYQSGYRSAQKIEKIIPTQQWQTCTGTAGTVILVDTARLMHRGKPPTAGDRYTLFYDYTSRIPSQPYYCKSSLPTTDLFTMTRHLTDNQLPYVLWRDA